METVNFLLPRTNLATFKGVAREMEIDLSTAEYENKEYYLATVVVHNHSQLITLGFLAGLNSITTSMTNEMFTIQNKLEKLVNDFNKNL